MSFWKMYIPYMLHLCLTKTATLFHLPIFHNYILLLSFNGIFRLCHCSHTGSGGGGGDHKRASGAVG